jgi:DNA replication ATP-dependent helicase Dna2
VLEPSFLSEIFGIQGRLDLLHVKLLADSSVKIDIIELKSGKSPANSGLWPNHWMQTVLYDMLINSVFGIQRSGGNTMILYSADTTQNRIRYSKTHHLYYRMIASEVRNQLIYFERSIAQSPQKAEIILNHYFWPNRIEKFPPYTQLRLKQIQKYISELNITEKSYFFHYISLIAREQWVSKVGNEFKAGQAALWKLSLEEKKQEGIILTNLKLIENQADNIENPQLIFIRYPACADPEEEMYVTNFRNGDIVLCYPVTNESKIAPVLTQQLFKGNLFYKAETHQFLFRLKYPQQQILNQDLEWRIEPDTNDNNFTALHRNMFEWAAATPEKRALILGLREPISDDPTTLIIEKAADLTASQTQLLQKALAAQEYFLLQGPPGTGKTSKMIKHLVKYLIANTQANIMLVAYTRRAVDEIIQAVQCAFEELALPADYIKIGQEENLSPRSLEYIARNATRRQELTKPIAAARVFVSTLLSLYSRHELFKLKKFDTLIVDEASQLLEPHLCGILTRFRRFILIGDEKQLPAVIQLSPENTAVSKTTNYGNEMHQIGLTDLRNSLFERLLHICQQNRWTHAYGMLTEQGRMHQRIGNFVSQTFYENKLTLLNHERQTQRPYLFSKLSTNPNERMLATNRIVFCHCTPADISVQSKTNPAEAVQVAAFTKLFIEKIHAHNEPINETTLGIITPFRAQISLIRQQLRKEFENHPLQHLLEHISIETVERYQGSTRRIIIISFVITQPQQLSQISAWNAEKTVDRKLNVALSRAQEYIVICGNEDILSTEPVYRKLIAYAAENTPE